MLIQLWFRPTAETLPGKGYFELVDLPFDTFQDACDAIAADSLISTTFLHTRASTPGTRVIMRRVEGAFRGGAVERVQVPYWTLVENAA